MARIRTIKPDFFRHEGLQDLAAEHGAHVMLVFAGLWGHCDKAGRFEWRPRQLKLDILPFLDFDMLETLEILVDGGMIEWYENIKEYGVIRSFPDHQRISGKELQEPEKYPEPPMNAHGRIVEASGKHPGSIRDQQEFQEGNGREEEGNGVNPAPKKPARFDPLAIELPEPIPLQAWGEWIAYRRGRKLTCSEQTMRAQVAKLTEWHGSGHSPPEIISSSIANGWQGLFEPKTGGANGSRSDRTSATIAKLTGANRPHARTFDGDADRLD